MANRPTRFAAVPFLVFLLFVGALASTAVGCAHRDDSWPILQAPTPGGPMPPETGPPAPRVEAQIGYATWYGQALAGRKTASGERFDPRQLTAAHRKLPFGTWVEVQKLDTGDVVRVRITDRGPYGHPDRIIDLSRAAAERIGMLKSGRARVRIRIVEGP